MKKLLKISEFAHLSGITRKNLIYYDDIGLLPPEQVLENGYRFYSHRQLETASVIGALQEFGMPLSDIKRHLDERTPEKLIELFSLQKKNVENKILKLRRIEAMINTRLKITHKALTIDLSKIEVIQCKEQLLFVGDEVIHNESETLFENDIKEFYDICEQENITYGYPFGTIVSQENLLKEIWYNPFYFFFKIPKNESSHHRLTKPEGNYLVGYDLSSYDGPEKLYKRMFEYIKTHKLKIIGNSYEEFLLDEIAVKNANQYLLQVSIQVE